MFDSNMNHQNTHDNESVATHPKYKISSILRMRVWVKNVMMYVWKITTPMNICNAGKARQRRAVTPRTGQSEDGGRNLIDGLRVQPHRYLFRIFPRVMGEHQSEAVNLSSHFP